jgi:hypothetical protein
MAGMNDGVVIFGRWKSRYGELKEMIRVEEQGKARYFLPILVYLLLPFWYK